MLGSALKAASFKQPFEQYSPYQLDIAHTLYCSITLKPSARNTDAMCALVKPKAGTPAMKMASTCNATHVCATQWLVVNKDVARA